MKFQSNGLFAYMELIIVASWRARCARTLEMTMARFDPDLFPDRFELDRYARRMRQQEITRLTRLVGAAWHRWVAQLTGAAPAGYGLHTS
jgi:hypothetical protein